MPTCFLCGKSVEKLTPTGMCPECSGASSRPQPSIDVTLLGLSETQRAEVLRQREELRAKEAARNRKLQNLADRGLDGYYEYKVVDLRDYITGSVDISKMTEILNDLGLDGWRLRTAYSNDLGTNSMNIGNAKLNSAVGQNILIFDRFVRL